MIEVEPPSPFGADGVQWAWNATSLTLLMECPKKYYYAQVIGWRAKGPSVHLDFGGHYAKALERYHKLRADGQDHRGALASAVAGALDDTWLNREPDGSGGAPWVSDHNAKTRETLIRSIVWYLENWKDDPCKTVVLENGAAAVELSFQLPVSDSVTLVGHLDRLVEFQGDLYVQDQKTTGSSFSARYFDQWDLSVQMSTYTLAAKAVFNTPVKGVIIDAAQIAVGFTAFQRGFTFRTERQMEEFLSTVHHYVGQARQFTEAKQWPMNTTACDKFGGCQFRKICSKDPGQRERFLRADFEIKPFNPLEIR